MYFMTRSAVAIKGKELLNFLEQKIPEGLYLDYDRFYI